MNNKQTIQLPDWMSEAIKEIAEKYDTTTNSIILEFTRKYLESMGYASNIWKKDFKKKPLLKRVK